MPWRIYSDNCPECQIRCIANMDQASRPPLYERIERECGHKAMLIVKERVGLEVVRMRLLRDGKKA
jgi:hypothetical protein